MAVLSTEAALARVQVLAVVLGAALAQEEALRVAPGAPLALGAPPARQDLDVCRP